MKTINKKTLTRQQAIREEIYAILRDEAHTRFKSIDDRENSLQKRLSSIENAGISSGTLEKIEHDISGLKHSVRQQTKAIEELLTFFSITKTFLNNQNLQP